MDSSESAGNNNSYNESDSIDTISSQNENEILVSDIKLYFICILYATFQTANDSEYFSFIHKTHNQTFTNTSIASFDNQFDFIYQDGELRKMKLIARTIIYFFYCILIGSDDSYSER